MAPTKQSLIDRRLAASGYEAAAANYERLAALSTELANLQSYLLGLFLALLFSTSCSSLPLSILPPSTLPGAPQGPWELCLAMVEAEVREVVTPDVADAFDGRELGCLRMQAAAECAATFGQLHADRPELVGGEWCAEDLDHALKKEVGDRCRGVERTPLLSVVSAEITDGLLRRIAAALRRGGVR